MILFILEYVFIQINFICCHFISFLFTPARCYYNLLHTIAIHKTQLTLAHSQISQKLEGGSPRGNDTGGPNGMPGGGKSGKNGRGRGRSSGASPRGRSPHIEPDILGGRIPAS